MTDSTGQAVITSPSQPRPGWPSRVTFAGVLITAAGLLLLALAAAMGAVSWHAQFEFINAIKHERVAAVLEALGLDCGAVVFAILGIALARLGRRAFIERALVCVCAVGSCAMNAAGADLGSPRSVAVFIMPPLLFAITSDRLISVIRRSALGPKADAEAQRSAWGLAVTALLYVLRFALAPPSTAKGARLALLAATPLPEIAAPSCEERPALPAASPRAITAPKRNASRQGETSKTARFLQNVTDTYGDLAYFPLDKVSPVAKELAPEVGLDWGAARTALRKAVLTARNGDQS